MRYHIKTDKEVICYDEVTGTVFIISEKRLKETIAALNWELATEGILSLDRYVGMLIDSRESMPRDHYKGFARIDDKSRFQIQQMNDNKFGIDYVIVPPNM